MSDYYSKSFLHVRASDISVSTIIKYNRALLAPHGSLPSILNLSPFKERRQRLLPTNVLCRIVHLYMAHKSSCRGSGGQPDGEGGPGGEGQAGGLVDLSGQLVGKEHCFLENIFDASFAD